MTDWNEVWTSSSFSSTIDVSEEYEEVESEGEDFGDSGVQLTATEVQPELLASDPSLTGQERVEQEIGWILEDITEPEILVTAMDIAPANQAILSDLFVIPPALLSVAADIFANIFDFVFNPWQAGRSEEHTSELQSRQYLVCRLLLEKKKIFYTLYSIYN